MIDHTPEDSCHLLETWLCRLQRWLVLVLVIGAAALLPAQLARTAVYSAGALYPTEPARIRHN